MKLFKIAISLKTTSKQAKIKLSFIALFVAAAINQALAIDDHFYTTSPTSEETLEAAFHYEKIICFVPDQSVAGIVTVYRWDNPTTAAHFWTTSPAGEEAPALGYYYESPAYFIFDVSLSPPAGSVPWYRWNAEYDYFYSTDYAEGEDAE